MIQGERFNGYTHLAGALLALPGAIVLVVMASLRADPWRIVSLSIYGATLFLLYLVSTLYHSTRGRPKAVLRKLDHSAIYLLMGWVALVAFVPLLEALTWKGLAWMAAGGVIYTVGIVFYHYDEKFRHWHGIWHLFVLAGSAVHYFAILSFVA